ncbi:hypothetical protein DL766_007900 [Monosporascus sp. MC13-8B]|uniref:Fungal STAND N-terminal Goodbye domain-containing protein n=1 Tax=Monosporascus cannonballus TaxID=155416 RepID=A0ABY0HH56_9PEZI|nr:hypothetical protein DL762_001633 [Monosporascus cannonballus]RYP01551.1 hypothetical protein DL763_000082 [Monosporascus cannonballus]RYP21598.1 hypothetical protein DL766_007900 [Monosporascus sp. MC13-8B]
MGIIYPDNQNRANRVQQLAVNIGSIQSEANDSLDRVDTAIKHQLKTVDDILKLEGFTSVEQLNAKIQGMMTPEQRATYEEQVKHIRNQNEITDKILEASTAVSFIAGVTGLAAAPVARILSTGALAAGADLFGRGFRAMLNGEEAGLAMMRAAFRTFRALRIGGEVSETAAKVARLVRTAAAVLSILGVVLDGIVLIYSAIEGAKQKDELQKAIRELCARRFQTKQLEDQLFATETYCSQVSAFLITYNVLKQQGQSEASIKIIMDALLKNVVENLTQDLAKITEDKIWGQVGDIDKQSNVAWTDDDPSHEWVKAFIESQEPLVPDHEDSVMAKSMLSRMEVELPEKGEVHTS